MPALEEESDEEVPVQMPSTAEAEHAAELLLLYLERQDGTSATQIKAIRQAREAAKVQRIEQAKQSTLDSWLI